MTKRYSDQLITANPSPISLRSQASAGAVITDYQTRIALEQSQALERKQRDLAEQSSHLNGPEARIRAWEHAHRLALPTNSTHAVLRVVAAVTHLTLEQVHDEQKRRAIVRQSTSAVTQ